MGIYTAPAYCAGAVLVLVGYGVYIDKLFNMAYNNNWI